MLFVDEEDGNAECEVEDEEERKGRCERCGRGRIRPKKNVMRSNIGRGSRRDERIYYNHM